MNCQLLHSKTQQFILLVTVIKKEKNTDKLKEKKTANKKKKKADSQQKEK